MCCDDGNEEAYCSDCRATTVVVLDHATGDTICTSCGLVLEARYVDETSEWRTFSGDNGGEDRDRSRVGASDPFLAHALGTVVAPAKQQANAAGAAAGTSLWHAARVDSEARSGQDNALLAGFRAISDMADRLGLVSTIRDRANELLKMLEGAKLCKRGQHRDTTYAACLNIACRNEGKPRTLKELTSVMRAGYDKKEIGRMSKIIRTYLGEEAGQAMEVGVVCAADYMARFGSRLGIAAAELRAAQRAAQVLDEKLDVRRNPESIAAAIIYMVAQRAGAKTSARDVSTVTGVAEATIKEATKELNEHAELLFT
ncbi:transcription initiation factor IIB-2-like [Oryza brachyantha]|uniref:TFIIB-type domain-containing protein n=1 Tax=Oryza brachyantha TaxID=4533 RepID=J3LKX4_ORYBR|nr:transcription initiation factor IIB-2-like [Oryza brachyantha]